MADKIEQVYNAYKADNATKAASLQQFKNWMYGDNYRRGIYNDLKKQGANVGTFEHFSQALGYRAKSNVAKAASNYVAPQKGYTIDTSDYDPKVPNSIARVTEKDRQGVLDGTYLQRLNNKRTRKVQGAVGIENQTGAQQSVGFDKKKRLKITRDDYKPLYRSKGKGFNPAIMTDLGNGIVADYSADDETGSTLSLPRTDVKLSDDVNRAAEELNKQIVEETAKKIDAKNAEAWRNELKGSQIGSAAGGELMGLSIVKGANQKYGSFASSKEVLQQIAKGYVSDKAKQLVAKKAEQLGIEPDALWKQMLYGMEKTVRDRYVDLEMPKTDFEYAMRGISNSIIGSMGKRMALGAGDRDIISEGEQKYADQVEKRANEQGLWSGASAAKYGNIATGMATDALAFAGAGKAAGATMNVLGKGLNLITKTPLGKSLIGRVVGTSASELTKKYGAEGAARILNFVGNNKSLMGTLLTDGAKGTLQSGLTLGNYGIMQYTTGEGYDKLAKGEDGWWSGLIDSYGEQFKTGLKFGAVGAVGGAVGRGVGITGTEASMLQKVKHGLTKATVSTGAFVAESLAFRSEQMADEWARDNKINFVDNLVQGACENLTIKLSGGHYGQFKPKNILRGMLMNGKDSRIVLNDAEKKEFLSNTNAKSFQAACEALNPDHRTKEELNGDKKTPLSGHNADGNPVSKMAKFLEDPNISLRTRQKVAAALGGVVSKSVPRATMIAVTPIEKGKYAVKTYSKDNELLSVDEFSNKEKAEAKQQEIIDRRDDRDFKNKYLGAMNNLSQEDEKWILEKAAEDLGFSSVAEWNLTRALDKSNKEEDDKVFNEAFRKRMAERKGMRAKTVLDIQREVNEEYGVDLDKVMGKDPTLRKASERAAVEEFSKRLNEVVVDKNDGEQQAEMASQSGAEIAEQADINNSEEFTESSKQVNDRLNAATEAWMEIVKNNPDIEDYMKHNPDTDILEMRELFGDEVADAYLELSNAQAAKDGFINQTGQKIEVEVQSQVTQSIFQGKINGEEDKENVYLLTTENGQSWTLVGGDVEIGEDGSVKVREDGGVAIARDENGNTVQLTNLEGLKAQRISIKDYENKIRTTLQEQKTREIQASEGQLPVGKQPETPQVPKQPNRPTESEPGGNEPKGIEPSGNEPPNGENPSSGNNPPANNEPLPADDKPESGNNPAGNNESETMKFRDGTDVPMTEEGEPDFGKMTPEHGAELYKDTFGDDAEKMVNDEVKAAEKELKNAEKMKVGGKSWSEKTASKKAKDAAIEAAKTKLERANAIKKALTTQTIAEGMGDNGAGEAEQGGNTNERTARAKQRFDSAPKVKGRHGSITLPNGEEIEGTYYVVSADGLTPTHDPFNHFGKHPDAPVDQEGRTLNDRDYEHDGEAQNTVLKHGGEYNGLAVDNVPVVLSNGLVVSGNERTMAGQIAAKSGTDKAYKEKLRKNAEGYGIKPEELDGIENGRLIFVPDKDMPYTTETFRKFNKPTEKKQGGTETAIANSKTLKPEEVGAIISEIDGSGSLEAFFNNPKATTDLFKTLVEKGVIGQNEIAGYVDDQGKISVEGKELVKNLLIGAVFKPETIRMMGNDSALKTKVVSGIRAITENMKLGKYNLKEEIDEAVKLLAEARSHNMKVDELLRQQDAFGENASEKYSNMAQAIAQALEGSTTLFRDLVREYNDIASQRNTGEGNLFGEAQSKEDFVKEFVESSRILKENSLKTYGTEERHQEGERGNNVPSNAKPAKEGEGKEPTGAAKPTEGGEVKKNEQPEHPAGEESPTHEETGETGTKEKTEREKYIEEHPMTEEQIDATDAPEARKEAAKRYLSGEDESGLAKASYRSVFNKIKSNKSDNPSEPPASGGGATEEQPKGETASKPSKSKGKSEPKPKEGEKPKGKKDKNLKGTASGARQEKLNKMKEIEARLKAAKDKGKKDDSPFDFYNVEALTDEQNDIMLEYIEAGADLSYELLKDGTVKSKEEFKKFLNENLADGLKDATGYSDKDVDDLFEDLWNWRYKDPETKETKLISDWAKDFGVTDNEPKNNENNGKEEGNKVDTGNVVVEKPKGSIPEPGGAGNGGGTVESANGRGSAGADSETSRNGNGGHNRQSARHKPNERGGENNGTLQGGAKFGKRGAELPHDGGGSKGANSVGKTGDVLPDVGRNALASIEQEKVPYQSPSDPGNKHAIGSVIPSGIALSVKKAFDKLVKEVKKNVTDFVRDELGYSSDEEMFEGLSSEQVDSVALAIHSMKKGKSFIIGDQTGVGKGRQAASLIRWAKKNGKKVIFVTESSKLFSDMYGDIQDIGSEYMPFTINNDTEANITDRTGKVVVRHPNAQTLEALFKSGTYELPKDKKGKQYDLLMMTYSQGSVAKKEKLEWIRQYAKDAVVIMDESHNASGASTRGQFFSEIIDNAAGVTFLSATYAKRPDNMAIYAQRSSLADVNMPRKALIEAIQQYGVPMQEILADGLFGSGEMIRRERDMTGVKTKWMKPEEMYDKASSEKARHTSDKTMEIVNNIINFQRAFVAPIVAEHEKEVAQQNVMAAKMGAPTIHYDSTPYSSQVSNIVNLMVYGLKAKKAAEMAIEQIKEGKKPVIAVENTMGSYVNEIEDSVPDAGFGRIFEKGIKFSLRYTMSQSVMNESTGQYKKDKSTEQVFDAYEELPDAGRRTLDMIRQQIEAYLGDTNIEQLSLSPIDMVKNMIAEAGYNCGEITGRTKQLVKNEDGSYSATSLSIKKKDAASRFNGGSSEAKMPEKEQYDALVLNVAGATGISLHASAKFGNTKPRTMIILQPSRDVNTEVQMRGRIDRTGQLHRGEYYYLTSPIPAEQKSIMMLKQKLASLDANSVGTEEVSSNRVEAEDMDNKYGNEAAKELLLDHLNDINNQLENGQCLTFNNKTREWEAPDNLLYGLLKGIQRLDCETQEFVINELATRYKDKIDYLNQNGINDLKSTTMNLEAVTDVSETFIKGKDENSPNIFAHNTNIERVEANVLKKPLRSSDMQSRMKKYGVYDENGKLDVTHPDKIDQSLAEYKRAKLAERQQKLDAALDTLVEKQKKIYPKNEAETDEEYEARIQQLPAVKEMKQKNENTINQFRTDLGKQAAVVSKAGTYLKPGMPCFVPLTDALDNGAAMSYGRFLGFEKGKDGNPRSYKAVFAVKDSRAVISIPCVNSEKVIAKIIENSRDMELREITKNSDTGDQYSWYEPEYQKAVDAWWDAKIPKNTNRQHRYMITGNILQACGSLGKYKGQIVTFTRRNPETGEITLERGMLLAENFDPENFKVRTQVTKEDVWNSHNEIKDDMSKISVRRQGNTLVVTFKKQGSQKLADHPVFQDAELAGIALKAADGTAYSKGKTSVSMSFAEKNAEKALELLYKNHSFTKEKYFVMPDSKDKPDRIVRTGKSAEEVIKDLKGKYGNSLWRVEDEINRMLKRYRMDVNNEELKGKITEAVQLRQAYYRERYTNMPTSRLGWEVLIYEQRMEQASRQMENAETDEQMRDMKEERQKCYNIREAILEEIESRGEAKGTSLHLEQGQWTAKDAKGLFDKLNTDKENQRIMDKVFEKVKDLGMQVVLDEKIDASIGGRAAGNVIEYNWKYLNAEYLPDQAKANTILHEMIHTVTAYADHLVEQGMEHMLKPEMVEAINDLHSILDAIKDQEVFKHDGVKQYGLTNVREMLAEAGSNESFRTDLKKAGLWTRMLDGILRFFGFERSGAKKANAYDSVMARLEGLIEGFDEDAWRKTYAGTVYGGYSEKRTDLQPSGDVRYRKVYIINRDKTEEGKRFRGALKALESGEKLNTEVKIEHFARDVENPEIRAALERGENVKGWYDIKTGEVHLYLPNITDKYDALKTAAHEVIGHKGMRGLLGEEGYKDMMRRMYTHMSDADVSEVNRRMMQNGWDFYTAMDEYVADKAEDTVWNPEAASLWENIRHYATEAIQKAGCRIIPSVNDVKYWLWESKRGLKGGDAYTEMKRSSLLWKLNNTKTSLEDMISEDYEANETHSSEKEEAIRYRKDTLDPQKDDTPLQSGTKTAIEIELASKGSKRIECWVDDKHGLKVVQQHLGEGITGGIDASIDPYHGAIAQSSIVREKQSHFQNTEMAKMNEEIRKCTLALGGGKQAYEDLNIYAYVKSGLERNRVLFVRDAAGKVDRQVGKINKEIAKADPNMSRLTVKGVEEYRDTFHTMKSQLDAQLRAGKIDMRQYCDKMDEFIANYRFNYDGVAEHAPCIDELNEWYDKNVAQKYDPNTNDYSGIMSIEQFQVNGGSPNDALIDHVMQTENTLGKENADKLWDTVNGVTSLSLKNSYEYQNIDKAAYDRASSMFTFYLPMRGWKAETMEDSYTYMRAGFGSKGGSELKHAKGRTTLASSPFGTACSLAMNSIARGEDNRNKQRLYRLAYRWIKEHTTTDDEGNSRLTEEAPVMISEVWYEKRTDPVTGDEYWEAVSPDIKPDDSAAKIRNKVEQFQTTMEAAEKLGNAKRTAQNGVYDKHFDVNAHKNEHIVYVNIGGRQKMIIFPGNPRAAQAINGDLKSDKGTSKLMRGMAAMFTSYNITFSITNTSRDTVFANNNVAVRESPKYWLKFTNNQRMLLGGMARGMVALNTPKLRGAYYEMWNRYKNGEAPQNKRERYFKEFMENGGKTGFVETKTIKDLENAIRKNATESKAFGISAKDIFKAVPDIVEAMNERAENLNRFAAYLTSRQMGRGIMRSVQDAKEVSTNFNRKGAGSAAYRGDDNATRAEKFQGWLHDHAKSCYLFFNAGMQSLALLSYNIKHHPVRTAAYTVAIPMLFANAIVPMANAWLASVYGEDDDDVYSNLPEWDRRNNLCLYKGKGQWVKIPLPIEIRAFYGLGDCALGMINKSYESTKTPAIDVLSQLTQALPLDFMGEGGDAIGAMLPDVMKPGYHIIANKGWTGKPLYKRNPWNTYEPEWQKQFKGEADWEVEASKWLNEMTGGGDHVKGWADGMWTTNPAVWDEIVSGYLGGAGSDAGRFVKLGSRAATGNWEDFSVREIPMVRALYSTPTERTQYYRVTNKYNKYKEQSKEYEHNLKAWGKSDDPLEKAHFIRDNHEQVPELRQMHEIKQAEKKLKVQRKIANNEKNSDKVRKEAQLKAYNIQRDVVNKIESGL